MEIVYYCHMSLAKYTALLVFIMATVVCAQSGNSVISGNVKDASSLAVPNAKVIIKNTESGVQMETVTNDQGLYRAGALLPGIYRVEVDVTGFDHLSRGPIALQVSQTLA